MTAFNPSYIHEAIEQVSAWDLPEEDFADAVNAQARLMAGFGLDPTEPYVTIAVQAHLPS